MKTGSYGPTDIKRWVDAYVNDIDVLRERIQRGEDRGGRELRKLAARHEYAGLTEIARRNYGRALGHFAASAEASCVLLERKLRGDDVAPYLIDTVGYRPLLLACATSESRLLDRLASAYQLLFDSQQKRVSHHLALLIAALVMRDTKRFDRLREQSVEMKPGQREEFDLVLSIERLDKTAFLDCLTFFVEWWSDKVASEGLSTLPDAVCDHLTIGRMRMAERFWETPIRVPIDNIPLEIFAARPEPVTQGIET